MVNGSSLYCHIRLRIKISIQRIDLKKVNQGVYSPVINAEFGAGYDPIRYPKEDTTSKSLSMPV